jgi:preprotein translocase subunit Sss1
MVEGYADKETKRLQELLYTAWHIEAFARKKKLPRLETVLKPRHRRKPEASKPGREELINIARLKGLKGPWDRA